MASDTIAYDVVMQISCGEFFFPRTGFRGGDFMMMICEDIKNFFVFLKILFFIFKFFQFYINPPSGEFSMLVLISAENFDVRDMKSPPINATMSSFGSVECYVHAE